jgi:hypothetical protein
MLTLEGRAEEHLNVTAEEGYYFTREKSLLENWTLQVLARAHALSLRKLDTF